MVRSLIQFTRNCERGVAALADDGSTRVVTGVATTLMLAHQAADKGAKLADLAAQWQGQRSTLPTSRCSPRSITPTRPI